MYQDKYCNLHQNQVFININVNPTRGTASRFLCPLCYDDLSKGKQAETVNLKNFLQNPFKELFAQEDRCKMFNQDYVKYLNYASTEFSKVLDKAVEDIKKHINDLSNFLLGYINEVKQFKTMVLSLEQTYANQLNLEKVFESYQYLNALEQASLNTCNQQFDTLFKAIAENSNDNIKKQFTEIQQQINKCQLLHQMYPRTKQVGSHILDLIQDLNLALFKEKRQLFKESDLTLINGLDSNDKKFFKNKIMPLIANKQYKLVYKYEPMEYRQFQTNISKCSAFRLLLAETANKQVIGLYSPNLKFKSDDYQSYDRQNTFMFSITKGEIYPFIGKSPNDCFKVKTTDTELRLDIDNLSLFLDFYQNDSSNLAINATQKAFPPSFSAEMSMYQHFEYKLSYLLDQELETTAVEALEIYE